MPSPTQTTTPPLRVALLIDSFEQPAWVATLIDDILSSEVADVALVVRNTAESGPPPVRGSFVGRVGRWIENRNSLLLALYERLDAKKFMTADDPWRLVDVAPRLAGVPVLDVTPRQTKFSDFFNDADVERVLAYELDVALRLGFRILRGRALQVARFGVWSYHHGDNLVNRGGPPGFWEVMEQHPTTGTVLQVLSEDLDAGRVIYRSHAATSPLSVTKNRAGYFWKSSAFVIRKLRDVHECGEAALADPHPHAGGPLPYGERLYTAPTNAEFAPYLASLVRRYVEAKAHSVLEREQWSLAYRFAGKPSAATTTGSVVPDAAPFRFRELAPPADRFWADPFPIRVDGRYHVLFEELEFARPKGVICSIELDEKGPVGAPVRVLERPYHLSYPYTFEWRGELFMMPESVANRTVECYRATRAPHEWRLESVLHSDVSLLDATVAEIGGRWWMFAAAVARGGSRCDELNLYHATSPLGPWTAHPRNPVISDVRHARPAGRPFSVGGQWYRPAQDCSLRYGYAIAMRRIVRLDPTAFEEETVGVLRPNWHPRAIATHTINAVDGLTVIDVQMRRSRWGRRS